MFASGIFFALLGAALSLCLPAIGSAKGVGLVGEAGAGLISQEPEKFSKVYILQFLPSTQGILGFVTAITLIIKVGLFSGKLAVLSQEQGLTLLVLVLPMAFVGLLSATYQGRVAASGVSVIAKQPALTVKSMILVVAVEFFTLIAFLFSFITVIKFPV